MDHQKPNLDSPPMDYQSALERVGMDREFLAELIVLYQTEFHKFFDRIKTANNCGDFSSVSKLAHSLKGSSANLGFSGIGDISKKLEAAGNSRDQQEIEKNLAVLKMEYQRVKTYLINIKVS